MHFNTTTTPQTRQHGEFHDPIRVIEDAARVLDDPDQATFDTKEDADTGATADEPSDAPASGEALPAAGDGSTTPPLRRILVIADAVVLTIAWALAVVVFDWRTADSEYTPGLLRLVGSVAFGVFAGISISSVAGLYRRRICRVRSLELARIARVAGTMAVLGAFTAGGDGAETAVVVGVTAGTTSLVLLGVVRGFLREWIHGRRAGGEYRAPVIIVGGGTEVLRTAEFLNDHPVLGFDVRGLAGPREPDDTEGFTWHGTPDSIAKAVAATNATGVVLDGASLSGNELNEAMRSARSAGLYVHVASGLRGIDWRRITVSPLADETYLHIAPSTLTSAQKGAKRVLDVAVAGALVLITAPLLLLIALAVRLSDGGPALFRQERVGRDGEPFTLLKFRTMVVDAERRRAEIEAANARSGPLFKMNRDPRVTAIGRLLRSSSLDELPQLFNVLAGSMSMVGPRPALQDEVDQFDDELASRERVKPGLTGLWQVEARDLPSFDLYRRYDLLYVENWSLMLDVAIIARTATATAMRGMRALVPSSPFRGSSSRPHALLD